MSKTWSPFYTSYSHKAKNPSETHTCSSLPTVYLPHCCWYSLILSKGNQYGIVALPWIHYTVCTDCILSWLAQVWDEARIRACWIISVSGVCWCTESQFTVLIHCRCEARLNSEAVETGRDKGRGGTLTLNTAYCWQHIHTVWRFHVHPIINLAPSLSPSPLLLLCWYWNNSIYSTDPQRISSVANRKTNKHTHTLCTTVTLALLQMDSAPPDLQHI